MIVFVEGLATVMQGRKKIAVIVDRIVRYKLQYHQSRYSVEIPRLKGAFDCLNMDEVNNILSKYAK